MRTLLPMTDVQLTIEDILLQQGFLKPDQVSQIKLESINTGKSIEKIILEHSYTSEDNIAQARALLLGIPFIKLEGRAISAEVINLIPEAVALRYKLVPFDKDLDSVSIAMVDPLDLQVVQFLEKKSGLVIKRFLGLETDITTTIKEQYSQNLTTDVTSALKEVSEFNGVEKPTEEKAEIIRDAPVANIVTQLLEYAIKSKASDIHIEPQEDKTRVRYRIDGILHEKVILPKKVHDAVISRIKILAALKIDEKRLPQDGRFTFSFGNNLLMDLRISTLPTVFGEKVVMRLLPKSQKAPTLMELGIRAGALKNLEFQLQRPHGIILICGPTGSGKTTTLYSVLSKLSTSKVNILTVEDPVEYQIMGVNQVQVNTQVGLTFASALRSFLRQDPNIILVGEIRDAETTDLAIQAALTGHEVFSTLHTNSSAGSIPRLMDLGAEPFLLSSAINAALGQRILRKVCNKCRLSYSPPPEVVENIKTVLGKLAPKEAIQLYKGNGCSECGNSGYQGRCGIYELLVVTEKISKLILERATTAEIEAQSVEDGMITMKQDGYLKALEGITTIEEVLRVAQD